MTITASQQTSAATGDPVLLNEVLASHVGTDDTEFIELFGTPGTSLAGLSVIVVESDVFSPGTIDRRFDFKPFHSLGPNGFFLIGNCGGVPANYGVTPDASIFSNYLENSSLTVALVETASLTGDAVTGAETVRDAVALTDGDAGDTFFFGAPVIGPDGPFFPAGARRAIDGVDTDTVADWVFGSFFLPGDNSPVGGGLDGCAPIEVSIPEIQGDGQFSPYQGETVRTTGVVTLITANGRDMWIQDVDGDGNPATSDGIFVDDRDRLDPEPEVGDIVTIIGQVQEQQFGNQLPRTRIDNTELVSIDSTGNPLPATVPLVDLPNELVENGIDFWEPLEGMLVSVDNGFVVAATSRFGEFGMLVQADANAELGSGYFSQTKQILIRSLGGGDVDYNPERILVDDASIDDPVIVTPGDRVRSLVGVVDYTFGNYKLQPASVEVKNHNLPKVPVSRRSGGFGNTTITTYNVENLFDLVDNPDKDDEGSTPSPAQLETQLAKLALAVEIELQLPEILVVQEVENTAILQVLGDLVNAATGTDYTAVSFETSDGRGIEVGFLWDAERVSLVDAFQMSGPDVEAAFGPGSASPGREPLVGVFDIDGSAVTIIGNHFKSKGGDDPIFGVNQPPIRITEAQRKDQAQAVRNFVNGLLGANPDARVIVAGDLNDFQFGEPGEGPDHPLAILEGNAGEVPLTNLINLEKPAEAFTFVFDGNSQVLDHILISPGLMEDYTAVDILHFNAGFPSALGSVPGTSIRASDHDAVEARFRL
jgi:predicted extracellular nuclease